MMSDLIDRQAAIEALESEKVYMTAYKDGVSDGNIFAQYNRGLNDGIDKLKQLPAAEPKRKTGRWIEEHIDITDKEHPKSFRFYRCSACSHVAAPALFVDKEKWLNYCPNCGAYMGGEQDGSD